MAMRVRPVLALALSALLLGGCSTGGDDAAPSTTSAATSSTEPTETTPTTGSTTSSEPGGSGIAEADCPDTDAVAELVGAPVERQASFGGVSNSDLDGNSLGYSYQGCEYELTGDADGEVAVTRITEHDADGSIFAAAEATVLADFAEDGLEPLPDLGDDAYRSGSEVAVLVGDVMVFVEASDSTGETSPDLTLELTEAVLSEGAGLLAETELDCEELGAIAPISFGTVESTGPAPGTTIIDELTITTEGCQLDFDRGTSGRVGVTSGGQWDAWLAAERGSMFTVEYTSLEIAGHRAFDDGDTLLVDDDAEHPLRINSDGNGLGPDPADLRRRLAELALG